MKARSLFAALALVLLRGESAHPSSAFGYQDLETLIRNEDIRSIETLLPRLPLELRGGITFMHASRSLQEGSPANPRVLLFGETAELVLSFNGREDQLGYDELEVLEFNSKANRFFLRAIQFARNGGAKAVISQPNPARCTTCHGTDPRPLWDGYNFWRGAYGSIDDVLNPQPACEPGECPRGEAEWFADFSSDARRHPRYRWISWPTGDWSWPYRADLLDPNRGLSRMPNTRLTLLHSAHAARSFARRMEESTALRKYRGGALYGLLCEPSSQVARDALERIKSCSQVPEEEIWIESRADWIATIGKVDPGGLSSWELTALRLFALLGLPYGSTATTLKMPRGSYIETGFPNGLRGGGSISYVALGLLRAAAAEDPRIAQSLKANTTGLPASYNDVSPAFRREVHEAFVDGARVTTDLCLHLETKALEEMRIAPGCAPPKDPPRVSGKEILAKAGCIACHSRSGATRMGPVIPFDDPIAFARFERESSARGRSILKIIESRIAADSPAKPRMPLAGADLTPAEQALLLQYLR
jgi:hypothetical protein